MENIAKFSLKKLEVIVSPIDKVGVFCWQKFVYLTESGNTVI